MFSCCVTRSRALPSLETEAKHSIRQNIRKKIIEYSLGNGEQLVV